MKKYKIAFLVNHFPSISETFILNQILDLLERGHEIKIYSCNSKKSELIHGPVDQFKLVEKTTYFPQPRKSSVKKLGQFFIFLLRNFKVLYRDLNFKIFSSRVLRKAFRDYFLSLSLQNFLNNTNFDIVHAHFGQRGALVANLLATGKIRKVKLVVTFHGHDLNPLFVNRYKKEYKNIFQFADGITVNSKYLQEILLTVCHAPKNLTLLPVGLKTDQYIKDSTLVNRSLSIFTIVFCGRLVEFKAPDLAVRIMDILVNTRHFKNVVLRIIGDGKLRSYVEDLIKSLALEKHVLLLGALNQEQVIQEMDRADLFLLPGIHERETGRAETQGLVIQEAQAMELPVMVSNAGGMKYGLLDGISGFVVEERDLVSFADKIECLMKDEALRVKMGKAGRDFVVRNFDSRILGDKLLKIYSEL